MYTTFYHISITTCTLYYLHIPQYLTIYTHSVCKYIHIISISILYLIYLYKIYTLLYTYIYIFTYIGVYVGCFFIIDENLVVVLAHVYVCSYAVLSRTCIHSPCVRTCSCVYSDQSQS